MLNIKGLSFGYHQQRKQLEQLELTLASGDILGLLGPNGAGKTTLASLIVGLLKPDAGSILLDGQVTGLGRAALVPQEFAFYPRLSALENLLYFAAACGLRGKDKHSAVVDALSAVELTDQQHQLAERYSGGLKRRLNVAIALLQRPQLLILDEPTANVDPQSRLFLLETVRRINRSGVTIIYTSHLLDEVESLCNQVALMSQGRIILRGAMAELLQAQPLLQIQLEGPLPASFQSLPGVKPLAPQHWQFDLSLLRQSPGEFLQQLEASGLKPLSCHYGQRRLEEVFMTALAQEQHP